MLPRTGSKLNSPNLARRIGSIVDPAGNYLILQAIVSFGFGAYIAGRLRRPLAAGPADEVESRDGLHGLAVWALAVVLGSMVAAFVGPTRLR